MSKRIHIVSFDVPFPADYGGVIDVFTRVKWFSENGWEVILHCFEYKRPKAPELEKYAEVHYYSRPKGLKYWFSKLPFIVNTRINEKLELILKNTKDEVLLEGLHCAQYLNLQPGKFYLRTHNIEHEYYQKLSETVPNLKKTFFRSEAKKLKKYEPILSKAKGLLVISKGELDHFKALNKNCFLIPSIIDLQTEYRETDKYILFHGNLSIEENEEAALEILDTIAFYVQGNELIFAGKNPSNTLIKKCKLYGVKVIANPSESEMFDLVQKARVHFLWTNNSAGLKLKFLTAMASSGHVICSESMVVGSEIEKGFHLYSHKTEATALLDKYFDHLLPKEDFEMRQKELNAKSGVQKLTELFG